MSESLRDLADEFRDQSLATLEAHPEWTRDWLLRTYPPDEDSGELITLDELSSDDLALAAAELAEELAPPTWED